VYVIWEKTEKGQKRDYICRSLDVVSVFDVLESVHCSKIHLKNPTKFNNVSKFYYSVFM